MLRAQLQQAYNDALKARDTVTTQTMRLILAALKDRDIAARGRDKDETVEDAEILSMLHSMVKQRRESIRLYEEGCRLDLAEEEQAEIDVIKRFLPAQLEGAELSQALTSSIQAVQATCIKDMGKVMGHLKQTYAGRMDFAAASAQVRTLLGDC